ncbi:hypothetical protein HHK36_029875 [Tetracentron sinense]|uniref:UDP-glycosyltransferases domain-containing protein n=1 Tax=Tetracentron sinense TaxID=13715 RepID=A0A835CZR2_TETSI|nr:hypothetical protein HHK36_029875 [Tetracentron sinense]
MKQLYSPILQWFQAHPSPPTAILSDLFLGWTHHLASELRIPRIIFSPSGALAVSLANFNWRDLPKREDPNNPNFPISFPKVPNSPVFPWCHLSFLFRAYVEGNTYLQIVRDDWLANIASWGLVVNSFSELEGVYLDHLKKDMGHDRVWAVGPLSPLEATERCGSSSIPTHELMNWLDTCGDHSVVYICFGSQAILSNKQMEELAAGLEASDARFIWCVKEVKGENGCAEFGMVPTGFTDRVVGKGLVIRGWVPQVEILRHKSMGVFLTHCGWNSVLEGLVAGVPMIAWPMGADQFINARLLVEEMGVAVKVCEGEDSIPNSEDVARVVVESLGENWPMRVRAKELSVAALGAIKEGTGSSTKDLDGLVKELCMLN